MATQDNDSNIIVKEFKTGFMQNQNYSVEVDAESIGISHTKQLMFSKYMFQGVINNQINDN